MDKDLYFIVGVLISLSRAHSGAPPRLFSEKMSSWITQGPNFIKSSIVLADLPRGTDICEKLHRGNLGLDTVTELFKPVLNPEGTNRRRKEVSTLAYWNDYLSDVKEGESTLQFSDILMFATGSESIPPCGFDTNPRLEFLPDSPNMRYPTANTCSCILRMPVTYNEYSEFKENFEFAVLNAVGFGIA
ncbi:G2/M phase-specific E3 ubiquitin-protein ligase-like [Haliotis cracherodii]|uniref:G2/M phase-specific E3 ubiquitin-protein ligase-like n=1 Tax=Haliotis cracherodii TaxID=6455 RepID=UPI0039E9ACD6